MNYTDHIESVSEEIENHFGFKVKVIDKNIVVSSFIGEYLYKPQLFGHSIMAEFYRFCYCYALKLKQYGIENKNKEINT
jgi:hypothetical protein